MLIWKVHDITFSHNNQDLHLILNCHLFFPILNKQHGEEVSYISMLLEITKDLFIMAIRITISNHIELSIVRMFIVNRQGKVKKLNQDCWDKVLLHTKLVNLKFFHLNIKKIIIGKQ